MAMVLPWGLSNRRDSKQQRCYDKVIRLLNSHLPADLNERECFWWPCNSFWFSTRRWRKLASVSLVWHITLQLPFCNPKLHTFFSSAVLFSAKSFKCRVRSFTREPRERCLSSRPLFWSPRSCSSCCTWVTTYQQGRIRCVPNLSFPCRPLLALVMLVLHVTQFCWPTGERTTCENAWARIQHSSSHRYVIFKFGCSRSMSSICPSFREMTVFRNLEQKILSKR